jgi:methionyl-tRNA formyltransferase
MVDIVFLGIHDVGEEIYEWLCDRTDANVMAMLTRKEQLSVVKKLDPDLLVSGGFRHIVPEEILEIPDLGVVNMHGAYLPYNRGANPNVWPIIDGTPAGVSLHYMTPELDGGPIIDRRTVEKQPSDTAKSLLDRIRREAIRQFKQLWPAVRDGTVETTPQSDEAGSYHSRAEFIDLWELDLEESATYGEVIDHLRALTYPPHNNAYFEADGEHYFIELSITPAAETQESVGEYGERSTDS